MLSPTPLNFVLGYGIPDLAREAVRLGSLNGTMLDWAITPRSTFDIVPIYIKECSSPSAGFLVTNNCEMGGTEERVMVTEERVTVTEMGDKKIDDLVEINLRNTHWRGWIVRPYDWTMDSGVPTIVMGDIHRMSLGITAELPVVYSWIAAGGVYIGHRLPNQVALSAHQRILNTPDMMDAQVRKVDVLGVSCLFSFVWTCDKWELVVWGPVFGAVCPNEPFKLCADSTGGTGFASMGVAAGAGGAGVAAGAGSA